MMPPRDTRFAAQASWLEIDGAALRHNVATFREALGGGVRIGGVLKGNAYGHGFEQVLPIAHAACDTLYEIDPRDALLFGASDNNKARASRYVGVRGAIRPGDAGALARARVDAVLTAAGQPPLVRARRT